MGTRHLVAVQLDGEYRVAQYGQFDGYPTGAGETIRAFFQKDVDLNRLKERVRNCVQMNQDQIEMVNSKIENGGLDGMPHLSRHFSAEILQHIYDSTGEILLVNSLEFAADSLFCEWVYVVDLDKEVLEIFKGFVQEPLAEDERFYCLQVSDADWEPRYAGDRATPYPVKLETTVPLSDLPDFDMATVEKEDEDADG